MGFIVLTQPHTIKLCSALNRLETAALHNFVPSALSAAAIELQVTHYHWSSVYIGTKVHKFVQEYCQGMQAKDTLTTNRNDMKICQLSTYTGG